MLPRVLGPTSTIITGAGQHSFNTCLRCTWYRGCGPTHQIPVQCWANVAAHCWFNADQSSTVRKHVSFSQSCFNVDPQSATLACHWNSIGGLYVFPDCCNTLVTFKIPAPETPDSTIHWPIDDVMLGHWLRRLANIIPTKILTTNIIVIIIFLNTCQRRKYLT